MISLLMAVKNGERYIQEQIDSLLTQDYQDISIVIRDNNSQDRTRDIIKGYGNRLTLVCGKEVGLDAKGNFGKVLASHGGDYTMLADADDVWLPFKVTKTLKKMRELEGQYGFNTPLLVHSDLSVVDQNLHLIAPSMWRYSRLTPLKGMQTLNRALMQNTVTGNTLMVNRPLLELALPIPEEALMHDWWLALVASAFGVVGVINEPLLLYRQHKNNDTGAKKYSLFKKCFQRYESEKKKALHRQLLAQAELFHDRYKEILGKKELTVLKGFIRFMTSPPILRFKPMIQHRLCKSGFVRTICCGLSPYYPKI